jgi:PAS domain S-box-containing protein
MSQDSKGFMWFGTYDGLNRYDGYKFKIYKSEIGNPYSLSNNSVRFIYEDRSGNLWIGTDGGLNQFDREKERFIHYKYDSNDPNSLSSDRVQWICEDTSGILWVGTFVEGLNQFDREKKLFTRYLHNPKNPNSISHNLVSCVYVDRSGNLWAATDGGLNRFDRERNRFIHYQHDPNDPHSLSGNNAYRIYEDQYGILWIGIFGGGLDRFDREKGRFIHYRNSPDDPFSLSNDKVRSIYEDRSGSLWIGTDGGLDRFDREKGRFIHYRNSPDDPFSLSNNLVLSIYEDRSGTLWIGNDYGGINKFDRGKAKFVHCKKELNNSNSLSSDIIYSIYETNDGGERILWIGTEGGGLNKYNRGKKQFTHYQSDPNNPNSINDNNVRAIVEDRSRTLWIGTTNGLCQFDRTRRKFICYTTESNNPYSLSNNNVFSIYEDRLGFIWVGTYGGGLNRFDRKKNIFTHYLADPPNPKSLSDNFVWSICEDRNGTLWIGTENGGLNQFDREKNQFIHYQADLKDPNGLNSNKILCLHEDRSGMLWIGTTDGLNKFDRANKVFSHYREADGLLSNTIQSILEDDHGNLWLGTQKGLSKFTPSTKKIRNFTVSNGLQSNEFSVNGCFKSQSGELCFGGINGFNTFFPDSIKGNPYIPPIVITDFQIFNKSVSVGKEIDGHLILEKSITETKEIKLSYKENVFLFEFASLHLASPDNNQYAYMMEGFDKEWNYTDAGRRVVTYTNMSSGEYIFRVKGSNSDGVWNEEGASIRVIITPPFWQTLWFRFILLAVMAGVIFWVYKWRIQARNLVEKKRIEEVWAKERNLLRALIDTVPDCIYAKDTEGRFIIHNIAVEHKLGIEKSEQIIGKTDFDFYSPELAARYYDDDRAVIESGQPLLDREEPTVDAAGNQRWTSTTKVPLRDVQGKVIGTVGMGHDITERKQATEELKKSEEKYRSIFENVQDMYYETLFDGTILEVSPSIEFISRGQYKRADLVGKSMYEFYPDVKDRDTILAAMQKKSSVNDFEVRLRNRDGSFIPCSISAKMIFNAEGRPEKIIGSIHDITKRKLAEEASKQTEENFRRSLEDSPLGVRIVTTQGDTVYTNRAILDIYGYDNLEELKRTPIKDRYTPESYAEFKIRKEKRERGEFGPSKYEISIVRKNGEVRYVQVFRKEVFWNGARQFQVVCEDITERKNLEEQMRQMQRLEGLGTLAGGIAHDFNNILGIILAYITSIKRFKDDTKKLDLAVDTIVKAVERGKTLVQQILTFARKTETEFGPVDVSDVVMEITTMIYETFPKILTYDQNFEKGIPFINADRSQLHQALLNLCVNSRDAMPKGGVLTINTHMVSGLSLRNQHPDAAASGYICIEVSDTGEGMTEDIRNRIFEPFFTTKEQGKGTGLGLAVVFGVVQTHKGFIDVESELGKGTTFRLYLPASQAAEPISVKEEETLEEIPGGTETVLVVEDEEMLMMSLRMVLVEKGYKVLSAEDGLTALKIYQERKNDIALVLTDLGLPTITGMEVCQRIKKINPNERMVVATGYLDPEMKSEFLKAGIQHFLYKPYDLRKVLKVVREVLDEK